jgi:putative transposase
MLMKAAARFELRVEAACVMTTHYHAVVVGTCASLSPAMQWFHSRYARAFNRRYGRFGSVFAERFQCRTVDEDGVFDRCAYVIWNPVKAGLCDRLEDWPWSYSRLRADVY